MKKSRTVACLVKFSLEKPVVRTFTKNKAKFLINEKTKNKDKG